MVLNFLFVYFVYFVCFVVQPIRAHSWFKPFAPIRGSTHSRPFVVQTIRAHSRPFVVQTIRVHSCPFVVQTIRVHSWFWVLFVYFVPIRGSVFSFRVFRVFRGSTHSRPFAPIRGSSTSFRKKQAASDVFFEIICRLNHRGGVILGFSPPRITRNYVKEIYLSTCLTDGVVLRHYL